MLRALAPDGSEVVRRQQSSKTLQARICDVLQMLLVQDWNQRTMVGLEVLHALEVDRPLLRRPRQDQHLHFNRSVVRLRVAQEAEAALDELPVAVLILLAETEAEALEPGCVGLQDGPSLVVEESQHRQGDQQRFHVVEDDCVVLRLDPRVLRAARFSSRRDLWTERAGLM